jgi:hypothetical protein
VPAVARCAAVRAMNDDVLLTHFRFRPCTSLRLFEVGCGLLPSAPSRSSLVSPSLFALFLSYLLCWLLAAAPLLAGSPPSCCCYSVLLMQRHLAACVCLCGVVAPRCEKAARGGGVEEEALLTYLLSSVIVAVLAAAPHLLSAHDTSPAGTVSIKSTGHCSHAQHKRGGEDSHIHGASAQPCVGRRGAAKWSQGGLLNM